MRSIAGERSHAFRTVASSGLRPWQYILGKTFAMDVLVILLILPVAVQGLLQSLMQNKAQPDTPGYSFAHRSISSGSKLCRCWISNQCDDPFTHSSCRRHFLLLLLAKYSLQREVNRSIGANFTRNSPLTRIENFAFGRFVVADLLFFLVVMIASFVLATRAVDAHRWQG